MTSLTVPSLWVPASSPASPAIDMNLPIFQQLAEHLGRASMTTRPRSPGQQGGLHRRQQPPFDKLGRP